MNPISSRTTDLPRDLAQASDDQERSLLIFHLGAQAYAIPIEDVVQIIPMLKLTPVPQLEHAIEGVANIHGKFVPVIRARSRLGMDPIPLGLYTPIILAMAGDREVGLIVDDVVDVVHLPARKITSPDAILPEDIDRALILNGIVYQGDEAILVLDTRYLMRPAQARAISQAIQAMPERPRPTEAELFSQIARMKPPSPVAQPCPEAAVPPQANLPVNNGGGHGAAPVVVPAAPSVEMKAPVAASPAAESQPAAPARPEVGKKRSGGKAKQAQANPTEADNNGKGGSNGLRKRFKKVISAQMAELAADLPPVEGASLDSEAKPADTAASDTPASDTAAPDTSEGSR